MQTTLNDPAITRLLSKLLMLQLDYTAHSEKKVLTYGMLETKGSGWTSHETLRVLRIGAAVYFQYSAALACTYLCMPTQLNI